ncbi:hypothetical protein [Pedobacter changchengzhani]|uniref:hypothetical protein n=1 Tax=Pedobacter changchengzhani TaxID=2529274 RepID=UPI0014053CB2|nr:hypothetical protein [Pedobacter changchengzhani]
MKNQEIKTNSVELQSKKEWVKPEILSDKAVNTLGGINANSFEQASGASASYHS